LHVTADGLIGSLIDTDEIAPLLGGVNSVVHDLACCELGLLFEDLGWWLIILDACVIDIGLTDNTKFVFTNPSPESDSLWDFTLFDSGFGVQIEDLYHCLFTLSSSECDDVISSVHEKSFSLHWLSFEGEVFSRVNDSAIL